MESSADPTQPKSASPRRRIAQTAIVGLIAGLIGGGIVVGVDHTSGGTSSSAPAASSTSTTPIATTPVAAGGATNWVSVAANAMPGVVEISTTQNGTDQFGNPTQSAALGTGFVIDTNGDIVTNQHVVAKATSINVQFKDGTSVSGTVLGEDPSTDLAVIHVKVAAQALHPLPLGQAENVQIGQPVLAIGTPFGYTQSASSGIVSGLGREIQSPNGFTLANAIQTDAAVNHGNSGGPLLNQAGEVIGINAQIADSGVDANVGVAFAVPMNSAEKNIINELLHQGVASHPWLGVAGVSVTPQLAQSGVAKVSSGVLVTAVVPGGPADKAGIHGGNHATTVYGNAICAGGDVITHIGGTTVTSMTDLQTFLSSANVGSTVRATVVHANGTRGTATITLTKQPSSAPSISSGC